MDELTETKIAKPFFYKRWRNYFKKIKKSVSFSLENYIKYVNKIYIR